VANDALPISDKTTALSPGGTAEPVDLADAVGSIDGGAIDRLLLRFGGLMRRAAQARGLSEHDVDEVLQDIRIRLWKTRATDENLDALGASYLHKVAMSAVVDFLRRRTARREDTLDSVLTAETVPSSLQVAPVDASASSELTRRLDAALSGLVQNRRLVVQLHLEGYERHEIAGMTGWTEAKVRNLLYRGLDDLRALLRADGEDTP
jgi:RNA polymerase sigma factor (sigma-70 family)